jgi:F-type H+-transporting ATPase subunit b
MSGITLLGIGALGINFPGLLAQIINFGILLVILRLVAYKPIMRMLDERAARVRESLETAERIKEREADTTKQTEERLEEARREGQTLIAQAQQISARIQEEARQQAHGEAEALLARARNEIQLERDGAIARLRAEFADLTISAAERVIGQSLDRRAHRRLIDEVLAESSFKGDDGAC